MACYARRERTATANLPKIVTCNYKCRIWLFPNVSVELTIDAIEVALGNLIEKQRWLGYDHARMSIDAALAQVGVHHAIIDEPAKDVMVSDREVVQVGFIEVRMVGTME